MNKTVNINLAGIFFHIDESAYARLQRYLAAIKRSFEGMQGEDEIVADIEARIAELFNEKLTDPRQVISEKELEAIIAIMGQPEDYRVDDDVFEDEPRQKTYTYAEPKDSKKLFRDMDNAYVGGVSSGLGHYLAIDPLWIRLAWVALVLIGFGSPIIIYIILWILMPEASTTAEKLAMRGKAVNIDNIQQKVKEGFVNVADSVKNVDYGKYGNKARKGASGFFATVGNIILFCLKVIVKFIGVLLIIIGASTVIGLFVGLFAAGTLDIIQPEYLNYADIVNTTGVPIWLASLLVFFAVGIPFFFIFYLGLKILVTNLKSMPLAGKLSLLGLWLVSLIIVGVMGIKQASDHSFSGKVVKEERLNLATNDTLFIMMQGGDLINDDLFRSETFLMKEDANGDEVMVRKDVRLVLRNTIEKEAFFKVERSANGATYKIGQERAKAIDYDYEIVDNKLLFNGFFTTETANKFRDQEVRITVYVPEGMVVYADPNTNSYHMSSRRYNNKLSMSTTGKFVTMEDGSLNCPSCPEAESASWEDRRDDSGNTWEYRSYENGEVPDWEVEDAPIEETEILQEVDSLTITSDEEE